VYLKASNGNFVAMKVPRSRTLDVLGVNHRELAAALYAIENMKGTHRRGKDHQSVPQHGKLNHKYVGLSPNRATGGTYLKGGQKLDDDNENHWQAIKGFLAKVENLTVEFMEGAVLRGLQAAKKLGQWPSLRKDNLSIWAGISTARNHYLQVHTDQDFFLSMTLIVPASGELKPEEKDTVTHYFCFPKQGRSVAMKPLDLILFDATEWHCLSSGKTEGDFYCVSFYLKTLLVGKNDNSLTLTQMEGVILENLLKK
jgi:hypothetical protein